jgi:cellulose synthase/poly-beta-1,6-N-acetylglucosamine synthase-like glycosyltransferase
MLEAASGTAVPVIFDSNVRVEPDDIAKTIALFRDPGVGCVSNLFTGDRARSLEPGSSRFIC